MPDDRGTVDTLATTGFSYPPQPATPSTRATTCTWILDPIPSEHSTSTPQPTHSYRKSGRWKRQECSPNEYGHGPRKLSNWQSSGHTTQGRSQYRVAPPARVSRRRHTTRHGTASGYRQQPDQPTTTAKFKVTRPDMTLELKLKGLNLGTWDSLKQFNNIH
ncbi:hypothetical protein MRB53_032522 [Persea americana]|uniref:Uncharacterized protein n=1 Tax=Persea americana TaxID=3435 RepID=A0ACC2KSF7_PERAE|nr:hypothetical protein MRB53_032522 [Persea americana]